MLFGSKLHSANQSCLCVAVRVGAPHQLQSEETTGITRASFETIFQVPFLFPAGNSYSFFFFRNFIGDLFPWSQLQLISSKPDLCRIGDNVKNDLFETGTGAQISLT